MIFWWDMFFGFIFPSPMGPASRPNIILKFPHDTMIPGFCPRQVNGGTVPLASVVSSCLVAFTRRQKKCRYTGDLLRLISLKTVRETWFNWCCLECEDHFFWKQTLIFLDFSTVFLFPSFSTASCVSSIYSLSIFSGKRGFFGMAHDVLTLAIRSWTIKLLGLWVMVDFKSLFWLTPPNHQEIKVFQLFGFP